MINKQRVLFYLHDEYYLHTNIVQLSTSFWTRLFTILLLTENLRRLSPPKSTFITEYYYYMGWKRCAHYHQDPIQMILYIRKWWQRKNILVLNNRFYESQFQNVIDRLHSTPIMSPQMMSPQKHIGRVIDMIGQRCVTWEWN